MVGRDLHAQQRKDAGEQQAQDGGDERFAHKGAAQAGELAGGGGGVGRGERKDARGDAVACDAEKYFIIFLPYMKYISFLIRLFLRQTHT